jgi:hypothetical protein
VQKDKDKKGALDQDDILSKTANNFMGGMSYFKGFKGTFFSSEKDDKNKKP